MACSFLNGRSFKDILKPPTFSSPVGLGSGLESMVEREPIEKLSQIIMEKETHLSFANPFKPSKKKCQSLNEEGMIYPFNSLWK
jgi:hypothetical protein